MDVIDKCLDDRLAVLQSATTRADSVTKLALDNRMCCFSLPSLPVHSIKTSLRDQVGSGLASRVHNVAMSTHRRDKVSFLNSFAIKPTIRNHYPGFAPSTIAAITTRFPTKTAQVGNIIAWSFSSAPCQDKLRICAHTVGSSHPFSTGTPPSTLVIGRGSGHREAGRVGSNRLLTPFDTQLGEQQVLHLVEVSYSQFLVGARQSRVVRHTRQLQRSANRISCQEPLFHVSVAHPHVESHQHARSQLWKGKVVRAFRVRVLRQGMLGQPVGYPGYFHVSAFSPTRGLCAHTL